MAVYKCKMCGGDLNVTDESNVIECDYCGTVQTVPSADNEKKVALFNRANRLRLANEFDKAAGIYESIIAEFPEEAEAYWGIVLCTYGVEYVDDPATGKKIPTCHRSSFSSVMENDAFEQAYENADVVARRVYRDEAKRLEEIRKGIIEVSSKEEPYDIFICYKETDENGDRTIDSVIAQDVYDALTEKGYRVFFSRITLEDKLGQEYEPYIFAALNSAKVMLVFGTDYEYFDAVWVKNEWSRFLHLMSTGQKKTLIPCYKGIDAYDMPKEFAKLQSQDMGKVGAIQDLLRGIEKLLGGGSTVAQQQAAKNDNAQVENIKKMGFLSLKSGNKDTARVQFMEASKLTSSDPGVFFGLALAAKTYAEQESYLKEVCKLSPQISSDEMAYIDEKTYKDVMMLYTLVEEESRARYIVEHFPAILSDWVPYRQHVLHLAVSRNNYIVSKILIDAGATVKEPCTIRLNNGQEISKSSIILAVACNNVEMVKLLIQAGADVDQMSSYQAENGNIVETSSLNYSIMINKTDIVKVLLDAGADANKTHTSTKNKKVIGISRALDLAIDNDNEEIVKLLIDHGADLNEPEFYYSTDDSEVRRPPLVNAIVGKKENIGRMLLDAGADPGVLDKVKGKDGKLCSYTALYRTIRSGDEKIVELLIKGGADVNQTSIYINNKGEWVECPPLCNAIWLKNINIVKKLLDANANPSCEWRVNRDYGKGYIKSYYYSALYNAMSINDVEMVHMLIDAGADVNKASIRYKNFTKQTDFYNLTRCDFPPLYDAIVMENLEMVKILLDAGADWNHRIYNERQIVFTPLKKYGFSSYEKVDPSFLKKLKPLGGKCW